MKIAYIASGAANMYCGTCLHDNALAAALLRLGHDVALVPTYTPLRTDEADVSIDRIFFGAVNVYLQQKLAGFRRRSLAALDKPGVLRWASRLGASTDPAGLGGMALSVLKGEEGFQAAELEKLVAWLRDYERPEVVHLNNSMFAGFARRLKAEVGVPVLCSLQGEDLFLDGLREPWRSRVLATLRERAQDVDGFLVNSRYYADYMSRWLDIPAERLHVVRLGLSLAGFEQGAPAPRRDGPLTIGYLARVCPEKGLHLLVEAFRLLHERAPGRYRLRAAGYLGERDRRYFKDVEQKVAAWGLAGSFEYVGEVDRAGKIDFLRSLDLLSVPTTYREPKGLFVLEALANGVPVVEPRHGAFPEMIEATGGGLLVEPKSPEALAEGLKALLEDRERRHELGERGKAAVWAGWSDVHEAEATLAVYRRYVEAPAARVPA